LDNLLVNLVFFTYFGDFQYFFIFCQVYSVRRHVPWVNTDLGVLKHARVTQQPPRAVLTTGRASVNEVCGISIYYMTINFVLVH